MLVRAVVCSASLVVLLSARSPSPLAENQGEPCPGCADTSAQPTYANTCQPGDAGVVGTVSHHNGACWIVSDNCVMSYPCTPWMRVSVWTNYLCGGLLFRAGYVGASGVGGGRIVPKNYGPIDLDIVYEDYTGVDCGSSTAYSVGAEVYSKNCVTPGYTFEGSVTANGTFTCTACSN